MPTGGCYHDGRQQGGEHCDRQRLALLSRLGKRVHLVFGFGVVIDDLSCIVVAGILIFNRIERGITTVVIQGRCRTERGG